MKKIPTIFMRSEINRSIVTDSPNPECDWVFRGEGVATRKFDGTCCMIRGGKLFKRYDAKNGKTPPAGFEPAQEPDPITGHHPGWLPVGEGADDKWHREAFAQPMAIAEQAGGMGRMVEMVDGTYELIGPKIQGNPEKSIGHWLVAHGKQILDVGERTYENLTAYLISHAFEGIVFHHTDGRMAKIKRKDFM